MVLSKEHRKNKSLLNQLIICACVTNNCEKKEYFVCFFIATSGESCSEDLLSVNVRFMSVSIDCKI